MKKILGSDGRVHANNCAPVAERKKLNFLDRYLALLT